MKIKVWICVTGWTWTVVLVNSDTTPSITQRQISYFQYANAPAPHQYEFAFNRGSPDHQISRHELSKDGNFQAKVKNYVKFSINYQLLT